MLIRCIGHAEFLLTLDNGRRIVIDPYDAACGYPVAPTEADTLLISHGHHDHSAAENVSGVVQTIREAGSYDAGDGVSITAVETDHDGEGGARRGKTLMFVIEAEGLRVVHLGDLGRLLTPSEKTALGRVDVLMIPVGGYYTIDATEALATADFLGARVTLPMHYRTEANASWPIEGVDAYTRLCDGEVEFVDLLRVTAGDLRCQPVTAVLKPQSLK